MQMTRTQKIIWSIVIIIILFGGYVYIDKRMRNNTEGNLANTATTTDNSQVITDKNTGTVITTSGNGGYTITQVPVDNTPLPQPIPDLNRPVTAQGGANVSTDAILVATPRILALQAELKKNANNPDGWLGLGIFQKMAGDYQGAVISWTYASRLNPKDYVPLGDLGDLYANFLKNNAKAEMYYKEAIANGPTEVNLYTQLAEVYEYQFGDKTKALAIIAQGLTKLPNNPNLLQMQASLSK